jgi:crotonobetainyl-CoA hydratase
MTTQATPDPVVTERHGRTLVITINRPEVLNCVDVRVHLGVGGALEEAEADRDIRTIVLTGAGDRSFCAGADLKAVGRGESLLPEDPAARAWGFGGYVFHPISKPTIAAVNGLALGGGTELVLASDLAVAAGTARFGLTEVTWGLFASEGGVMRLPRQIPQKRALEMMFTGEQIDVDEALRLGLINRIVDPADVLSETLELAERINRNAPLAVAASKAVALGLDDGHLVDEADRARLTRRWQETVRASADFVEGPRAFAERRRPQWQGR